jgi:hypothetical protein
VPEVADDRLDVHRDDRSSSMISTSARVWPLDLRSASADQLVDVAGETPIRNPVSSGVNPSIAVRSSA